MAIRRQDGVTFEPSGDRVVILDPDGTVMTTLNAVGARIWQEFDGRRDIEALAADLAPGFEGVDAATLAADMAEFVENLRESGLVEDSD